MNGLLATGLMASCFLGASPAELLEERGGGRPTLSGPTVTADSPDGFFTVHWTEEGADRPGQMADADESGLPDAIDRILVGLERARESYEAAGYRAVGSDEFGGGTEAIDVYVRDIDAFGFAHPVATTVGTSCFMELDPQLDALGDGAAESVAAHELHHCVQYAYTTASHPWIYEATATFEQYRLFAGPALDAGLALLWNQRLRGAGQPLSTRGNRFEYSGFVFLKFWSEFGGVDHSRVVQLWEQLAEHSVWKEAVDLEAEAQWGRPFEEVALDLATWKLFACSRDDGEHWSASSHPCILPAVAVELEPLGPIDPPEAPQPFSWAFDDSPFTAMFGEVPVLDADLTPRVSCVVSPEGARVGLGLSAIDEAGVGTGQTTASGDSGTPVEVVYEGDLTAYGSVGLVVVSLADVPAELECNWTWEERPEPADPGDGSGCACGEVPDGRLGGGLLWLPVLLALAGGRWSRVRRR